MLKKTLSLIVLLLLPELAAATEVVDRIVLRVNNRIATLSEYEHRRNERIAMIEQADIDPEERRALLDEVGRTTMREMFDELLVLSRADQLGIEVTRSQVERAAAEVRQRFGLQTEEELDLALRQTGITPEQFRDQLHHNLLYQEVMGHEVYGRVRVEDEDILRYYREHADEFAVPMRLELQSLVVLEDAARDSEEVQRIAEGLYEELLAGRTLASLAEEHAEAGTTSDLIELGWVGPGDLAPALAEAVEDLQPGEISTPVRARGGLHLVEVLDRTEAGPRPLAEVQREIRARERERVFREAMLEFLQELEETAYLVADPPEEAEGFLEVVPDTPGDAPEEMPEESEPVPAD